MDYKSLKTTCLMPWKALYMTPSGESAPCCQTKLSTYKSPNIIATDLDDVYNSEMFRRMRSSIKKGELDPACEACANRSELGGMPHLINRLYSSEETNQIINSTNDDGSIDNIELGYLDLRFSNICNLTCRICYSGASSAWAAVEKKHLGYSPDIITKTETTSVWNKIKPTLTDVRRVIFTGGEPLLMKEHYDLMDFLLETNQTNIPINYLTNGTVSQYNNASVIKEYWQHFDSVTVGISIDGYKDMGEYMRQGLQWDIFVDNLVALQNEPIHTFIKPTISNINIWHFPDMIKGFINDGFLPKTSFKFGNELNFNIIYNTPEELSCTVIPHDTKVLIEQRFDECKTWLRQNTEWNEECLEQFDAIINYMWREDNYQQYAAALTRKVTDMDQWFKTSFYDIEPVYAALLLQ